MLTKKSIFTIEGIEELLSRLSTQMASGPGLICNQILVEAVKQIVPILQVIAAHFFKTGTLPEDWLSQCLNR